MAGNCLISLYQTTRMNKKEINPKNWIIITGRYMSKKLQAENPWPPKANTKILPFPTSLTPDSDFKSTITASKFDYQAQNKVQNEKTQATVPHPFRHKHSSLLGSLFLFQEAISDSPWNTWKGLPVWQRLSSH